VIEAPHLRDVANDGRAGNRWYEIKTIVRSPNSWDHAYENHTLAITMKPIKDAQEFIDLMERETDSGLTLGDTNSNRAAYDEVAAKVQEAALEQAGTSWWDTTQVYIDPSVDSSHVWTDDGKPPNAVPVERVDAFPSSPTEGDYVLRVDFLPNRLFRYQGGRWLLKEIDRKREWGTYNWTTKLAEFMTDRTEEMDSRPWQYRSIHDVGTSRQERFSPSPKLDGYADQQQLVREGLARSGNVPRTPQVDSGTADGEGTGVFGGIGSASGSGG
jgi:hypothetical protein